MKAIRKTLRATPKWAVVHLPIVTVVLLTGVVTQDTLRELFDEGSRLDTGVPTQIQQSQERFGVASPTQSISLAATPSGDLSTTSDLPPCDTVGNVPHDIVVLGNKDARFAFDVGYGEINLDLATDGRARARSAQELLLSEGSVVSSKANVGIRNTSSRWFPYEKSKIQSWVAAAVSGSLGQEVQDRVLIVSSGTVLTDSIRAGSIVILSGPGSLYLKSNSGLVNYSVVAPDADLTVGESVFVVSGTIVVGSIVHHGEGPSSLSVAPQTDQKLSFCGTR